MEPRGLKLRTVGLSALVCVLLAAATPALADWDPLDPYKMHFPQLPDPNGWDVRNTYYVGVADDFMCSESGLITDFHIWTSWKGDANVPLEEIDFIHTAIYADVPDPDPTDANTFSMPGTRLWHHDWGLEPPIGHVTVRDYGQGDQGWYDPGLGEVIENDHDLFWQWNFFIDQEPNALYQEKDTIYWLEVSFKLKLGSQGLLGWKTTADHWNDDAVWREIVEGQAPVWHEIRDPLEPAISLDMAFVITPEPGTMAILAIGSGLVLARRRRRR